MVLGNLTKTQGNQAMHLHLEGNVTTTRNEPASTRPTNNNRQSNNVDRTEHNEQQCTDRRPHTQPMHRTPTTGEQPTR
ncbi:hypothetical protein Taro_018694 [Colocasia esculenta]|uniref:Uncharacterized protein n=1 Tax=Colocasia esculenta TaxID=4460 RepID=A0A843UX10_COLES|nr:hypothetical protein [Colocasia esculenta]